MRKGTAIGLTVGATVLLAPIVLVGVLVWSIQSQVSRAEGLVTAKSAYEPAALALAKLCQSSQAFHSRGNDFRPAWCPQEVLSLNPMMVNIGGTSATVEFGGGFHHFGYALHLDPKCCDEDHNCWVLDFESEDNPTRTLTTFTLAKSERFDPVVLIAGAMKEFARRAASSHYSDGDVRERIAYALEFADAEVARKSIRDCAAANSGDWLDQLLAFRIDSPSDSAAASRLDAWASAHNEFTSWMLAAHAYAATGDTAGADRCVRKALNTPIADAGWVPYNARHIGAPIALMLAESNQPKSCLDLCDALLAYKDGGDLNARELGSLRSFAQTRLAGSSSTSQLPVIANAFDPFAEIDLSRLIAQPPTSTPDH